MYYIQFDKNISSVDNIHIHIQLKCFKDKLKLLGSVYKRIIKPLV